MFLISAKQTLNPPTKKTTVSCVLSWSRNSDASSKSSLTRKRSKRRRKLQSRNPRRNPTSKFLMDDGWTKQQLQFDWWTTNHVSFEDDADSGLEALWDKDSHYIRNELGRRISQKISNVLGSLQLTQADKVFERGCVWRCAGPIPSAGQ